MLFLIIINFLINIFSLFTIVMNIWDPFVSGLIIVINEAFFIVKIIQNKKIFTPIIISSILNVTYGLYVMELVKDYFTMDFLQMFIIIFSTFLWKIMSYFTEKKVKDYEKIDFQIEFKKDFKTVMMILFIISSIAILYEWKVAGGVPILRSDSETFRFTVSHSPLIHVLGIMNKIVASLIGIYLVIKQKIEFKKDFFIIIEMIIAELLMIGTAMRGEILTAPCVVGIAYFIKNQKSIKYYLLAMILVLVVIGVFPFVRNTNLYGESYKSSLKRISRIESLYYLTPTYQSFATNYSILALDFQIFPDKYEYGYGKYSILKEIPFVDLGRNIMDVQNKVLNNNFYSGLTATYMASWYADFGYLGCIISTILYCGILNVIYKKYKKNTNLFTFILYIYTFYCSLWLFYNSVFNITFVLYSLLIYFSLKLTIK